MKIQNLIISKKLLGYLEQKSQKNQTKIESSKAAIRGYQASQEITRDLVYCLVGHDIHKPNQEQKSIIERGQTMFAETGEQIRTEQKKLTKLEKKASRIDSCKTKVKRRITKKTKK